MMHVSQGPYSAHRPSMCTSALIRLPYLVTCNSKPRRLNKVTAHVYFLHYTVLLYMKLHSYTEPFYRSYTYTVRVLN